MDMSKIERVQARQVFDSRGNPTVEAAVITADGTFSAIVPSGASKGDYEAIELKDGESAFSGNGVIKAVNNVADIIAPQVLGKDPADQQSLDKLMIGLDDTENKSRLGANAILAVSLAVCRAGAASKEVPLYRHIADLAGIEELLLPIPCMNVINGGAHAGNELAVQEYMIMPVGAASFSEAMRMGVEVYQALRRIIMGKHGLTSVNVGDEGGFAPPLKKMEEPIELILQAIEKAGYAGKVKIGLDCAASEFFGKKPHESARSDDRYHLGGERLSGIELAGVYEWLVRKRPEIVSIEDPFEQNDFRSFAALTRSVGDRVQVVGDDLLVTNVSRIKRAIEAAACNCLLLKVNQIGTVSESIQAYKVAVSSGWRNMISHRSGETEDTFIADLAVGLAAGQIKSGAPCRSERIAKYNQLLRIEEELGSNAHYPIGLFK